MTDESRPGPLELVIVTGLSGAGRSTALAALEDLGFFCVDNLPMPVVRPTLEALVHRGIQRAGLGVDVRVGSYIDDAPGQIDALVSDGHYHLSVIFLDASDEALLRRFGSTRRPHPLSALRRPGGEREPVAVLDGIVIERERLGALRARATHVVDTTVSTVHDLRRQMVRLFGPGAERQPGMLTRVMSFGFKYGSPFDADVILDVRFLRNPYFVDELRDEVGTHPRVRDYVLEDAEGREFLRRTSDYVGYCLPRFEREGKSYLTIAFGCTGGKHRSVAMAEAVSAELRRRLGVRLDVVHRDIDRDRIPVPPISDRDWLGGGVRGGGAPV